MSTSIEPSEAAAKDLNFQFAIFQKLLINSSDFQFSTSRRLNMFGYINDLIWIEIKAYHSIIALRLLWFLFNGEAVALLIKFSNTITLWITDPITKDGCFLILLSIFDSFSQQACKAATIENIVTQNKASTVVTNKLLTNNECLCKSIR